MCDPFASEMGQGVGAEIFDPTTETILVSEQPYFPEQVPKDLSCTGQPRPNLRMMVVTNRDAGPLRSPGWDPRGPRPPQPRHPCGKESPGSDPGRFAMPVLQQTRAEDHGL